MLIEQLESKGFEQKDVGGNVRAMVRRRGDYTDVVTATGGDLPSDDDWLLVTYYGDWLSDPDADEVASADHECSPMHLLQMVDL